jgi:hypothetical protein
MKFEMFKALVDQIADLKMRVKVLEEKSGQPEPQ